MRDFNQDNRSDRRRGSFDRQGSGSRDFGKRPMYEAVCDECGKTCKVPFKPSGDKPIYCSSCFEKRGGGGRNSSSFRRPDRRRFDSGRPDRRQSYSGRPDTRNNNEQFNAINSKLDKILEMLTPAVVEKSAPKKKKPALKTKKTPKKK